MAARTGKSGRARRWRLVLLVLGAAAIALIGVVRLSGGDEPVEITNEFAVDEDEALNLQAEYRHLIDTGSLAAVRVETGSLVPDPLTVSGGDEVAFHNADESDLTIVFDGGDLPPLVLYPGEIQTVLFPDVGEHRYSAGGRIGLVRVSGA